MKIDYVDKEVLYPRFGYFQLPDQIQVRKDLPNCVQRFVLAHELYHSTDKETIWWRREIKANYTAMKQFPLGFIITMLMSLSPYRLLYYMKRFEERK